MIIRLVFFVIINVFSFYNVVGQSTEEFNVVINLALNGNKLVLNEQSSDSVIISSLKFYLTNFSLSKNGETTWEETESYHLVDASRPSSLKFTLEIPESLDFDEIHYLLGTDSSTNVAGAMGGDLDPTKGMYWAWNSGYINFKLEGKYKTTPFKFHLGGYSKPYPTVQKIKRTVNKAIVDGVYINFNVNDFIKKIDIIEQPKLMSPGKEAQRLSSLLATLFMINE